MGDGARPLPFVCGLPGGRGGRRVRAQPRGSMNVPPAARTWVLVRISACGSAEGIDAGAGAGADARVAAHHPPHPLGSIMAPRLARIVVVVVISRSLRRGWCAGPSATGGWASARRVGRRAGASVLSRCRPGAGLRPRGPWCGCSSPPQPSGSMTLRPPARTVVVVLIVCSRGAGGWRFTACRCRRWGRWCSGGLRPRAPWW